MTETLRTMWHYIVTAWRWIDTAHEFVVGLVETFPATALWTGIVLIVAIIVF